MTSRYASIDANKKLQLLNISAFFTGGEVELRAGP